MVSLAFRQSAIATETTCSTTRATGGGYTSAPEIVLSGGVQDYLIMYEGLTAEAPSLKPRTGTLSAERQHDLRCDAAATVQRAWRAHCYAVAQANQP